MSMVNFNATLRRMFTSLISLTTFSLFATLLATSCGLLEEEEATGPKPFPGKRWGPTMPIDHENRNAPYSVVAIAIQGDYVYATTRNAVYRTTYPDSSDWQKIADDLYYPHVDTAAGRVFVLSRSAVYFVEESTGQIFSWGRDCFSGTPWCMDIGHVVHVDGAWFVGGGYVAGVLREGAGEWRSVGVPASKVQGASKGAFLYAGGFFWLPSPDFAPIEINCEGKAVVGVLEVDDTFFVFHRRGVAVLEHMTLCREILSLDEAQTYHFSYRLKNLDGVVMPSVGLHFYDIEKNRMIEYRAWNQIHGGWLTRDGHILFAGKDGLYRVKREEIK